MRWLSRSVATLVSCPLVFAGSGGVCPARRPAVRLPTKRAAGTLEIEVARHIVLLVEDNPDSNAALETFLRAHGFEVVVAFNGQEALDRLRAGPRPSVILLDIMMPEKDGHAFRAEQRADPALASIPVIVFSGAYDVGSIAAQLGVRDYLTKPLDVQRLLDRVRRYCGDTQ